MTEQAKPPTAVELAVWQERAASGLMYRDDVLRLLAEVARLQGEVDAIQYAAHMPGDYEHGLPSWINQHLYGRLISLLDRDGRVIRRTEDVELMLQQRTEIAGLQEQVRRLREALGPLIDAAKDVLRDDTVSGSVGRSVLADLDEGVTVAALATKEGQ